MHLSHRARYCEQEDGATTKGEWRVQLTGATVLQASRRVARHDICSKKVVLQSSMTLEQLAFGAFNTLYY
jgi:hypothetical protein